jgi:hypothetical protein
MSIRTQQTIVHVHIIDEDGNVLADIDGTSAADGLAYYLSSRRIVDKPQIEVLWDIRQSGRDVHDDIVFSERHPITGVLERQLLAKEVPF